MRRCTRTMCRVRGCQVRWSYRVSGGETSYERADWLRCLNACYGSGGCHLVYAALAHGSHIHLACLGKYLGFDMAFGMPQRGGAALCHRHAPAARQFLEPQHAFTPRLLPVSSPWLLFLQAASIRVDLADRHCCDCALPPPT
jgi:hypothetical protein